MCTTCDLQQSAARSLASPFAAGDRHVEIVNFINDHNRRAAPFWWTYDGRPLRVA